MRINYIRLWAYLLISGTNEETLYHNFLQVTLGQGVVPVSLPSKGYWKYYLIRNGLKFGEVKNKTELNIKIEPHLHDKLVCKWHQRKHFLFLLLIFLDFFFCFIHFFLLCFKGQQPCICLCSSHWYYQALHVLTYTVLLLTPIFLPVVMLTTV